MLYQHQDPTILTKQDVYLRIAYDFSNLGNKAHLVFSGTIIVITIIVHLLSNVFVHRKWKKKNGLC